VAPVKAVCLSAHTASHWLLRSLTASATAAGKCTHLLLKRKCIRIRDLTYKTTLRVGKHTANRIEKTRPSKYNKSKLSANIFHNTKKIYALLETGYKKKVKVSDPVTGPVWPRGWVEL